ncbi:MAG: DNA adenine methylase, partial [Treponema sp.]|nr:DNA adenine methylase [Treponema sp.]
VGSYVVWRSVAWSVWVKGTNSVKLANKRAGVTAEYAVRFQQVQIECYDALRIIRSRDMEDSFVYLDPPYGEPIRAIMLGSVTKINWLELRESITGKFVLRSYRNKPLDEYTNAIRSLHICSNVFMI